MADAKGGDDKPGSKYAEDEFGLYQVDDKIWTMNEIRELPLFMEDVPSDISDNPDLLALQSLIYDDQTPEEVAEHFRKLGNEAFRSSENKISSQNALMAYSRGLEMECKDKALNSQLHSNRAAVSLRLKEYTKAVNDCKKAIHLDPQNVKAYFRATTASQGLGLTAQALEFCNGALQVSPKEKALLQLHKQLTQRLQTEEADRQALRRADEEAARARQYAGKAVEEALAARGAKLGPILFDMAMYALQEPPRPKIIDDSNAIAWPVVLLYDETNQSDYVESFDERCALEEQFQIMFPPDRRVEWDEEGKYVWDRLVAYLEVHPEQGSNTHLIQVATEVPLGEAVNGRHMSPCLVIYVLVAGSPAHCSFCASRSLPPP